MYVPIPNFFLLLSFNTLSVPYFKRYPQYFTILIKLHKYEIEIMMMLYSIFSENMNLIYCIHDFGHYVLHFIMIRWFNYFFKYIESWKLM